MSLTSRRKRSLDRRVHVRDASIFVIAVEGEKTEKQYFEGLFHSRKLRVEVLAATEGRSSPPHIKERLATYVREHRLAPQDERWLVLDTDRWGPKHLKALGEDAAQGAYHLAISNPCFEAWLLLHHTGDIEGLRPCDRVTARLRELLGGYSKKTLCLEDFRGRVAQAIERAEARSCASDRWPQAEGSDVFKLVKRLKEAMM